MSCLTVYFVIVVRSFLSFAFMMMIKNRRELSENDEWIRWGCRMRWAVKMPHCRTLSVGSLAPRKKDEKQEEMVKSPFDMRPSKVVVSIIMAPHQAQVENYDSPTIMRSSSIEHQTYFIVFNSALCLIIYLISRWTRRLIHRLTILSSDGPENSLLCGRRRRDSYTVDRYDMEHEQLTLKLMRDSVQGQVSLNITNTNEIYSREEKR